MGKNRFLSVLFSFMIVISFHSHCYADKKPEIYTIGVEDTKYLPHYTTEDSIYSGFAREILDLFAQYGSLEFNYYPFPVKRLFTEFLNEQIDFKYPDNARWQVDLKKGRTIFYSDVVVHYMSGAVVKPQQLGNGIQQIKTLGVVRGFTPLPFMDLIHSKKISTFENRDFPGVIKQALNGRVDAAYVNLSVVRYQLREVFKQPDALVFDPDLPKLRSSFHLSTIKHPELIDQFNHFMVEKAAEIKALKVKYDVDLN